MAGREGTGFPDRGRFMAYCARVMRALIIDHARRRQAQKRGGRFELLPLDERTMAAELPHAELAGSARPSTSWPRSSRRWPRWST